MYGIELIKELHAVADRLTANPEVHRELVSRMATHMLQVQSTTEPTTSPGELNRTQPFDFTTIIAPHLSERQKQIWGQLMLGHGVRQVGRNIGISHVAVIKQRRKIIEIIREVLGRPDTAMVGLPGQARQGHGQAPVLERSA